MSELTGRLVRAARKAIYLNNIPGHTLPEKDFDDHARGAVVTVLRELAQGDEEPCYLGTNLLALADEIEQKP